MRQLIKATVDLEPIPVGSAPGLLSIGSAGKGGAGNLDRMRNGLRLHGLQRRIMGFLNVVDWPGYSK